jgi:hypothetical protein
MKEAFGRMLGSKTLETCHKHLNEIDSPPLVENPDLNGNDPESAFLHDPAHLNPSCSARTNLPMNFDIRKP